MCLQNATEDEDSRSATGKKEIMRKLRECQSTCLLYTMLEDTKKVDHHIAPHSVTKWSHLQSV